MKTALITTTINVPHVLKLYRKFGPQVQMFVAGDHKTPSAIFELINELKAVTYFEPSSQSRWSCSDPIGWNCIQRRNIALLEAVKWGAEMIVSVDDDNAPLDANYFRDFWTALSGPFSGISTDGDDTWFDVGGFLDPIAPHRGIPQPHIDPALLYVVDAKVGVAAGICLGNPDIDAVYRMAVGPTVHRVSELLYAGVVVRPPTRTVFNSQNTAFIRDLAPAMFMPPGLGRHDDIYASLICQAVMQAHDLHVRFGRPFVWQQRNEHSLLSDVRAELWGMENILDFAGSLDKILFSDTDSILTMVRAIWSNARIQRLLPEQSWKAALAFLDDLEPLL